MFIYLTNTEVDLTQRMRQRKKRLPHVSDLIARASLQGDADALRWGNGIYFVKEASLIDDCLAPLPNGMKRLIMSEILSL